MAERSQQSQAAVPPPPARKRAVQVGCVCTMLSVAMYGLVFATLTAPILESVDAMGYVSLFTVFGVAYSVCTVADPTSPELIQNGVNAVFIIEAAVTLVGFLLAVLVIRPKMEARQAWAGRTATQNAS